MDAYLYRVQGADRKYHRGLGAVVARKFAAEGCNVAINYVSRETAAKDVAEALRREFRIKTIVIQGVSGFSQRPSRNLASYGDGQLMRPVLTNGSGK